MRKRNIKAFADILDSMPQITFATTWSGARQALSENPSFTNDKDLQNMDKEDALIVFEEHIRQLEQEEKEEKDRENLRIRRYQRKNREAFMQFLRELHDRNQLNSMSLWCELYPIICTDQRFFNMLGQPGSTALDLFKFYVEDLKAKFTEEKRLIKEILKGSAFEFYQEKQFEVELNTTYEQFQDVLKQDSHFSAIDVGNMKLTYNSLIDKAECKEKERLKEEQRKHKRLESAFRNALKHVAPAVTPTSKWDEVRLKICNEPAFLAVTPEANRITMFNEYISLLAESCAHHHSHGKKKKKNKKQKKNEKQESSEESMDDEPDKMKKNSKKKKKKSSKGDLSENNVNPMRKHSSSDEYERDKKKRRGDNEASRRKNHDSGDDSEELSESELEKRRRLLLEELQEH
uniref:FF domain-containing protein n=1 Tax=Romanomermis culicivorax TaxID=13658 RepID=A0A915HXL3_ROMCU